MYGTKKEYLKWQGRKKNYQVIYKDRSIIIAVFQGKIKKSEATVKY